MDRHRFTQRVRDSLTAILLETIVLFLPGIAVASLLDSQNSLDGFGSSCITFIVNGPAGCLVFDVLVGC
jgi:hypothetical protein